MTTPFAYDELVGFQHTISVDSPQFSAARGTTSPAGPTAARRAT
jgi:hypothetical protein